MNKTENTDPPGTETRGAVVSASFLGSRIKPIWNRALWFLQWVQFYPATLNSKRFANVRSAKNTIELCCEIGLKPTCLFDVGANAGQWAFWLKREWPEIIVESFEPNTMLKPLGRVHHVALSNECYSGQMIGHDTSGCVVQDVNGNTQVVTFDKYWEHALIPSGSILKIDAETHSAKALLGFGERINEFAMVVIEIFWDNSRNGSDYHGQAATIMQFMLANGFINITSVDEAVYSGRTDFSDMAFWKEPNICREPHGKKPINKPIQTKT